jgi:hypothetical protein
VISTHYFPTIISLSSSFSRMGGDEPKTAPLHE